MVANIRAAKEIRMHGYLRCNPSYTNAIGVEIVTTQMWSLSKLCLHNCD